MKTLVHPLRWGTLGYLLCLLILSGVDAQAAIDLSIVDHTTLQNSVQVSTGQTFTLDLQIDTGGTSINGVSVFLTVNTSILEIQNPSAPFTQGTFLGGTVLENKSDSQKISYSEVQFSPKSGTGLIAQLELKALSDGSVNLDFEAQSPRNTSVSLTDGTTVTPDNLHSATIQIGQGGGSKSFTILSGDQQVGAVSQPLSQPFVVVVAEDGQPLVGVSVTFEVTSGGGAINGATTSVVPTDTNGKAEATLTLGSTVGAQQVRATLSGYATSLLFTATAQQTTVQRTLALLSGGEQSAPVGSNLPSPLVVQVTEGGQPISGVAVQFQVVSGAATLQTGTQTALQTTDTSGKAQAHVTLGSIPGENRIQVSLQEGGAPPVEFRATALSTNTNARVWLRNAATGDDQFSAAVGEVLSAEIGLLPNGDQVTGAHLYLSFDPTFVQILDQQPGNSGVQPFLKGSVIGGNLTENVAASGQLSYVETGGPGTQAEGVLATFQIKALAAVEQTFVSFEFNSAAQRVTMLDHTGGTGQPSSQGALVQIREPGNRCLRVAGNGQAGQAGTALASPLVVAVQDPQGDPVSGVSLTFTVQQSDAHFEGGGTSVQVTTEENGQAQAILVLGTSAGTNSTLVQVTGAGLNSVTFTASTLAGDAAQIALTSSNQQTAPAGSTLPQPLLVSVFDTNGNPVAGVSVFFQVTADNGTLSLSPGSRQQSTLSVPSDTTGKATAYWTLNTTTGDKQLIASAEGLQGSPITFHATAVAGSGSQIEVVSGQQQTGTVGTTLSDPLIVRVLDSLGNIATPTLVTFSVANGTGQLNGETSVSLVSDASGQAQATFTLGTQAGSANHQVKAELANGESVTLIASANAADAALLKKISGDEQTVAIQRQFSEALQIQVTDRFSNAVEGASVRFERTSGGGQLLPTGGTANNDSTVVTETSDASGHASIRVRAGTLAGTGIEQIKAELLPRIEKRQDLTQRRKGAKETQGKIVEMGQVVFFSLNVQPGNADRMVEVSGNGQTGSLNTALSQPFTVAIRDAFSNPVPGFTVQFVLTNGDGVGAILGDCPGTDTQACSDVTDETGQASTRLTLGTMAGTNVYRVEARAAGVTGAPVLFQASASPSGTLSLLKQRGDAQTGIVGRKLATPLAVLVEDAFHNPIGGVEVLFRVTLGNGSVSRVTLATDADGKTSVEWTLGTTAGDQHAVVARATGITSTVQFTAIAQADVAHQLTPIQGGGQTGIVGNALATPFIVQVDDRYGNRASGAEAVFTVTQGDGKLPGGRGQLTVVSDASGRASTTLTLGSTIGTDLYRVRAALTTGSSASVIFTASATAGAASSMAMVSGSGQTGAVGQALPQPLTVKVSDTDGNPVSNTTVRFEVRAGNGQFTNGSSLADTLTNSDGVASISFILGPSVGSQNHQVRASLANDPRVSVLFAASATHAPAAKLEILSGNGQEGDPNQELPEQLSVRLTDTLDNPVPQAAILFQVISGGGSIRSDGSFHSTETVLTDSDGEASVRFQFGTQAGENVQQVQASLSTNGSINAMFQASVSPGTATTLVKLGGDAQTGAVRAELPEPLKVAVRDTWGNGVPNALVTFRVTEGDGGLGQSWVIAQGQTRKSAQGQTRRSAPTSNVTADTAGIAQVYYTLGSKSGSETNRVQAFLAGSGGTPVIFSADATAQFSSLSINRLTTGELTGVVNTPLHPTLAVSLLDRYANPAEGVTVSYELAAGDGYFLNSQGAQVTTLDVVTDATGRAEALLVLGTQAGKDTHTVLARVANTPSLQVSFLISTTAGSVNTVEKLSGDDQTATVGQAVPDPLVVRARDPHGNIAVGASLVFRAVSGGVAPANEFPPTPRPQLMVSTDNNGIAEVSYVVGPQAGSRNHVVEVYVSGRTQPLVTFVASGSAGDPAQLVMLSGDQQTGTVGQPLPEPFAVSVTDAYGNPIPDVVVQFDVLKGDGTLNVGTLNVERANALSVRTDALGQARAQLTLGSEAGEGNHMAQALLPGMAIEPALFIASAVPDQGRKLLKAGGDHQVGSVGHPLDEPFAVAVRDRLGNVTSGVTLLFEVIEGNGTLQNGKSIYTVTTDAQGRAEARLTLGTAAGRENNAVQVSLPDQVAEKLTFRASAQPAGPEELILISGDNQIGIPGLPLSEPFVVSVVDRYGNPVTGVEVVFSILAGNSSFGGARTLTAASDVQGRAQALLALDTRAEILQIIEANAPVLAGSDGASVLFQATGKAGAPAHLNILSGDAQQGKVGQPLPEPFVVQLTDQHGNPIAGESIGFSRLVGNGAFVDLGKATGVLSLAVTTDALGQASARYILGTDVSEINQVSAMLVGNDLPQLTQIFKAQPLPATGASLVMLSGDNQLGTVGQTLAQPLIVLIRDAHNNIAPGATVHFEVLKGGGTVNVQRPNVQADALGQARVQFILGPEAGQHNHIVMVSPVDFNSPVLYFRASAQAGLATQLDILSGDGQEGTAAMPLDHALVVQVRDRFGNPIPGIAVEFSVIAGDGGVYDRHGSEVQAGTFLSVDTNSEGQAAAMWLLGPEAEIQNRVRANVPGIVAEPVEFSAVSHAGGDVQLSKQSGDRQFGIVGQPLPRPIEVLLMDQGGNRIAQAEVSFVVVEGGGRLEDGRRRYNTFTNDQGLASARWILGNQKGDENNSVQVTALDYATPPVLFKASAEPDSLHRLILAGGDGQRGVAESVLLDPLQVIALDRYNNPVDDVVVTLEVADGSGELLLDLPGTNGGTRVGVELLDLYTDTYGQAEALYRFGKLGDPYIETVRVTSPGLPNQESFFHLYKNAPPVFQPVPPQQAKENGFLQFEVLAEDPDGDILSYKVENLPVGADFDLGNSLTPRPKLFRWRPGYADAGEHQVQFVATDGLGNATTLTVSINVLDVNRPPLLTVEAEQTLREGETFTLDLGASDPDGDILSYQLDPLPTGTKIDTLTGTLVWIPGFSQAGSYPLMLSVSDGKGGQVEQMLLLTVEDVPKPPIFEPVPAMRVSEGEPAEIQLVATDPDGGSVRFEAPTLPDGAQLDANKGLFRWTPNYDQAGDYQLDFIATDPALMQTTQTVRLTVLDQNQPPVLLEFPDHGLVLGNEAELIEFTLLASDPEGNEVTLTAEGIPSGAVFNTSQEANGTRGNFRWRPQYDQSGNYELSIVAQDLLQNRVEHNVTVSVLNVNRPPTILNAASDPNPFEFVVEEGDLVKFEIEASDPDGEELAYAVDPLPTDAQIEANTFRWQPGSQQSGVYRFNVRVIDPFGAEDKADGTITVLDKNHAPVWTPADPVSVAEGIAVEFFALATDPDGEGLTYTASDMPEGASFSPVIAQERTTGWFQWTPGFDQAGEYLVTLTATDGRGLQASQTVSITVEDRNQPPVIPGALSLLRNDRPLALAFGNDQTATVGLDKGDTLSFTLEASDADHDAIQWSVDGLPTGADWSPAQDGSGTFKWRPGVTQAGEYTLTFTATDIQQAAAQVQLHIRVREVDMAPVWSIKPSYVVRPGLEFRLPLQAIDPEGLSVHYRGESLPSGVRLDGDGLLWAPSTHQTGIHQLTLVAQAGESESRTTLKVLVNRVPWDLNGDDRIDIFDLVQLGQTMGSNTEEYPEVAINDLNGDGLIDILDLVIIGQHFGGRVEALAAPAVTDRRTSSGGHFWLEETPDGQTLMATLPDMVVGFEVEFSIQISDLGFRNSQSAIPNPIYVAPASQQWLWIPPVGVREPASPRQEGRLNEIGLDFIVAAASSGGQTMTAPLGRRSLLSFTHPTTTTLRVERVTLVQSDGRVLTMLGQKIEQASEPLRRTPPAETRLLANYPNPFNPETWIPFELADASPVRIRIYDAQGRPVRALDLGYREVGSYLGHDQAAYWDGRNDFGERLASGVYWVRLQTTQGQTTRRMVMGK